MASQLDRRSGARLVLILLALWLGLALAAGACGLLRNARAPLIPAIVATLTALVLLACGYAVPLREWVTQVDLRALIALHVTRFVGFYFMLSASRGKIPVEWAVPAGMGDNLVAAGALALLAMNASPRWLVLVWNTFALLDILFVVLSAMQLGLHDWRSMAFLRQLPLSLLPTFLVPLIIATHLIIFVRIAKQS
ncbi:MAG: hypothetical protein ACXWFY_04195 [Chthoniobacterales bacterium]